MAAPGGPGATLPAAVRPLAWSVAAGAVLLLVLAGAASLSLVPGQLDSAGREACALTRSAPGAEQRAEAVAVAARSGEGSLQRAAGRDGATTAGQRYAAVEHWCASND